MRVVCLLLLVALAAARPSMTAKEALGEDRVFRVYTPEHMKFESDEAAALRSIIGELDVWGTASDGGLEMRASRATGKTMASYGVNVTDVTDIHLEHFAFMEANWDTQLCEEEECAKGDDFYDRYQNIDNINNRIAEVIRRTPHAESYVWGRTTENREMRGIRIRKANIETGEWDKKARDVVFYFCGEHAREWLPPMFCVWQAEQIVARLEAADDEVSAMVEKYEVYILPVMNVDGYVFSMAGNSMWRKSRKTNQGSSCIGTDLNRNFIFRWNNGGSSSNPCSDTYHGVSPYDNPETAAMRTFYNSHQVVVQTDVHAYGQMWMHPWGWTRTLASDDPQMRRNGLATVTAIRSVNGLTFAHGSIANVIYIASGSSCDSFYGDNGVIYAYAPEVRGNSFQPPASNIRPSNAELWAGFLAQVANIED